MDLEKSEYELLKQAIGKGKFKAVCSIVQLKLRERGKYQAAEKLSEIAPLFDPHEFWDNQPVPRSTDEVSLDQSQFDRPIEEKKVSQVPQEAY